MLTPDILMRRIEIRNHTNTSAVIFGVLGIYHYTGRKQNHRVLLIQQLFMRATRKDVESNACPWEGDLDKVFPPFQVQMANNRLQPRIAGECQGSSFCCRMQTQRKSAPEIHMGLFTLCIFPRVYE